MRADFTGEYAKDRNGCAAWLLSAAFAVAAFVAALMVLTRAFEKAPHELEVLFDATGAETLEVSTSGDKGVILAAIPVAYDGLSCRWDVKIEAPGTKNARSWDAQVWIQSITTDTGAVPWENVATDGDWKLTDSQIGAGGKAFVCYGEGVPRSLSFSAEGSELKIVYSQHQWTGIMRLTVNGQTTEIDTWRENFATGTIVRRAPPQPTSVATGRTGGVFFTVRELAGADSVRILAKGGSVRIGRASFDGREVKVSAGGVVVLPGYNRLVRLPAAGIALVIALAAPFLALLIITPFRKNPFWTFAALATLVKLWMAGCDETLATPYDATGYMLSGLHGFWGMPFDAHSYDRQPGYPLLIAAGKMLGLPLRVWLELVYAGACASVASALPRLKFPSWAACLAYALMLFNPLSFPTFSFVYQDAAYASFFLLFVGSMLHALPRTKGRIVAAAAAGVSGALVWNTRPEHILAAFILVVFGVTILLLDRAETFSFSKADKSASKLLLPVISIIAAFTLSICTANRVGSMGLFATSNFQPQGFTDLYNELLAIDPVTPEAYHPVPRDAREKAYAASPSFATLKKYLEGPVLATYAPMSAYGKGPENDYGVFFFWGLRVAPWYLHGWNNAAELDRFYARCASELRLARENGEYEYTSVRAPFVDPRMELWLPFVQEGALTYWKTLTKPTTEYLYPETGKADASLFDEVALRRGALVKNNQAVWSTPSSPSIRAAKDAAALVSAVVTWSAALLLIPLCIHLVLRLRNRNLEPETMLAAALLTLVTAAFLSRFALLSVMHAVAFGAETRYIFPVAPLPALVVVTALVMAAKATRLRKSLPAHPDEPRPDNP